MKCNYLQYIIGEDEENSPPEVIAWSSDGLKLMEKSVFTCNIQGTTTKKFKRFNVY